MECIYTWASIHSPIHTVTHQWVTAAIQGAVLHPLGSVGVQCLAQGTLVDTVDSWSQDLNQQP